MPGLHELLEGVEDPRHSSYITYESRVLLYTRILGAAMRLGSTRRMTNAFNHTECIGNMGVLLGLAELEEIPHWSTINNYLERVSPEKLARIVPEIIKRVIRMRTFDGSRIRGKYWQVIVDGVHLYSFNQRHCPHCLTRTHRDKAGNVIWVEYYHCALEAKIVFHGNIVCSIGTEFIENEEEDVSKQDCERRAFYRLGAKIRSYFPRLPMCVTMDSLYACAPVMDICEANKWAYIIRFKEGSIPTVAQEYAALKKYEAKEAIERVQGDVKSRYTYVNGIEYQGYLINVVECAIDNQTHPFVFITNLPVDGRNCIQLSDDGRRRWKIENEGFNAQKNEGYGLTHLFSKDYAAMKNHYILIQLGYMIAQFLEESLPIWKTAKMTSYDIADRFRVAFQSTWLCGEDARSNTKNRRFRFT
jgi:hypothetical protein